MKMNGENAAYSFIYILFNLKKKIGWIKRVDVNASEYKNENEEKKIIIKTVKVRL